MVPGFPNHTGVPDNHWLHFESSMFITHVSEIPYEMTLKTAALRRNDSRIQNSWNVKHLLDLFIPFGITGRSTYRNLQSIAGFVSSGPQRCPEGVLAPSSTTRTTSVFCPPWDLNRKPSASPPSSPTLWPTTAEMAQSVVSISLSILVPRRQKSVSRNVCGHFILSILTLFAKCRIDSPPSPP